MNELTIFNFEGNSVRTIDRDGEPWFVAKDVADVLGYKNPSKAISDHCKCSETLRHNDSLGLDINPRGMTIIPERDIYRLVMKSKLEGALKFKE